MNGRRGRREPVGAPRTARPTAPDRQPLHAGDLRTAGTSARQGPPHGRDLRTTATHRPPGGRARLAARTDAADRAVTPRAARPATRGPSAVLTSVGAETLCARRCCARQGSARPAQRRVQDPAQRSFHAGDRGGPVQTSRRRSTSPDAGAPPPAAGKGCSARTPWRRAGHDLHGRARRTARGRGVTPWCSMPRVRPVLIDTRSRARPRRAATRVCSWPGP